MSILLKNISLSFLVSISLFANVQKIDECKVDLYYANGIMIDMNVTQAKHELRWKDIVEDMFIDNQEALKKIANAKIAYNRSQGFDDDVFESAEQVMSNEWGWEEFSGYFRTYLELKGYQESYDTHTPDLNAQVNAYKESIKLGHGVIVIAHSQGNYYTNEAYERLDTWMKDYFHMFGVATPANHVAGFLVDDATARYALFHNDFINFIVTALPSNLDDTNPDHNSFPSFAAHDFYESYMKVETSKSMINGFITDEIQKHSTTDSQWETDQELNKGTKDFKITLKHRFDTTIVSMQDIEVYPFEPSAKLYNVKDNIPGGNGWVKDNCGREEVLDLQYGYEDKADYGKGLNDVRIVDNTLEHGTDGDQKALTARYGAKEESYSNPASDQNLYGIDHDGDILIGGTGDDTFYYMSTKKYIYGGDGFDTYNVSGGETILDIDGNGKVVFDGDRVDIETITNDS
ncbi:MAG: hypothetical protein ACI81I_000169, partial [Arcobacteraceae bacterium]